MAKKNEETALAVKSEVDDLMAPAASLQTTGSGLGSEDLGMSDVILPRVSLLQGLSKPVVDDLPGAKAGVFWITPFNRPVTPNASTPLKFVTVKIFPAQRLWRPLTQGGGLECEAPSGNLMATSPNGVMGANLTVEQADGKEVVRWTGGHATDECYKCVYGLGASAAAAGREGQRGVGNGWLPKVVTVGNRQVRLEDSQRAPKCTSSIDVLALVALPAFKDEANGIDLPAEIVPAFISFSRTGHPAGKSLAGMIKMSPREPAWAKIYNLGCKKVQNDKGTFYVPTVQVFAFAKPALGERAAALYEETKTVAFRATMDEEEHVIDATPVSESAPPADDAPAPKDDF